MNPLVPGFGIPLNPPPQAPINHQQPQGPAGYQQPQAPPGYAPVQSPAPAGHAPVGVMSGLPAPQGFGAPAPAPQALPNGGAWSFSGTANIDPNTKLPPFPANFSGIVTVDVCKTITTTMKNQRAFIAEFTVQTSNLANLPPDHPNYVVVGSRRSWFQGINERMPSTALSSIVGFLYAILGYESARDAAQIAALAPQKDQLLNDLVSPSNPAKGKAAILQTSLKKTKQNTDFTIHTFSPLPKTAQAPAGQ